MIDIIFNTFLFIFLFSSYFICSLIAVILMMIIRTILTFKKKLKYKFTMKLKDLWLIHTMTFLGIYFPKEVFICYNKKIFSDFRKGKTPHKINKKFLILSNHCTYFDWLFVLCAFSRLGLYRDHLIVLKESLSRIPIYGYGMKAFGYIFLARNWAKDKEVLEKSLYEMKEREKFNLLLFPEGTFIDSETHEKSKKYCIENKISINIKSNIKSENKKKPLIKIKENIDDIKKYIDAGNIPNNNENNNSNIPENLCILNNVLLPRKTGYNKIKACLGDALDGVLDITLLVDPYVEYPSEKFTFYNVFIKRSFKRLNINFLIEFYEKMEDDENWIYELYHEKDKKIDKYKQGINNVHKETESIENFKNTTKELVRENHKNYEYASFLIWHSSSKYSYTLLFLFTSLALWFIINKIKGDT